MAGYRQVIDRKRIPVALLAMLLLHKLFSTFQATGCGQGGAYRVLYSTAREALNK
jgi:hypothetical protein